jgi:hypothetical protein
MRILTGILAIDDTEVWRRPLAAVLNALAIRACFPITANNAAATTVVAVTLEILVLNADDSLSSHIFAALGIARFAFILTYAIHTAR